MLLKVLQLLLLSTLEGAHALEHLVPIYERSVKLRTVNTYELSLATDGETTSATHTCTIDHDGI